MLLEKMVQQSTCIYVSNVDFLFVTPARRGFWEIVRSR